MLKNVKKGFDFLKTKLVRKNKGTRMKPERKKSRLRINRQGIASLVLCGTMFLSGCVVGRISSSKGLFNSSESKSYLSSYDNNTDSNDYYLDDGNIEIYYFDDVDHKKLENVPLGKITVDGHDTFVKYEAYNLAFRAIEEVDDEFQNNYVIFTPTEMFELLEKKFDISYYLSNLSSSDPEVVQDAQRMLIMAKRYYMNWLTFNSSIVLDYMEKEMQSSYKPGETLNVHYFDNSDTETISSTPIGKIDMDAYNAFVKFEAYNLAYRNIEGIDDSFEHSYTFTPYEMYELIKEKFNIDDLIQKTLSVDEKEADAAQRKLIMLKEYYEQWLKYNDQIVLDYLEVKVK